MLLPKKALFVYHTLTLLGLYSIYYSDDKCRLVDVDGTSQVLEPGPLVGLTIYSLVYRVLAQVAEMLQSSCSKYLLVSVSCPKWSGHKTQKACFSSSTSFYLHVHPLFRGDWQRKEAFCVYAVLVQLNYTTLKPVMRWIFRS